MTIMHLWTLHNTDYCWQPESWDPCHNFGGRCRRKIFVYAKLSLKQQQSCKQYDGYYCYSNSAVITGRHSSIGLLPLLLPPHYQVLIIIAVIVIVIQVSLENSFREFIIGWCASESNLCRKAPIYNGIVVVFCNKGIFLTKTDLSNNLRV